MLRLMSKLFQAHHQINANAKWYEIKYARNVMDPRFVGLEKADRVSARESDTNIEFINSINEN